MHVPLGDPLVRIGNDHVPQELIKPPPVNRYNSFRQPSQLGTSIHVLTREFDLTKLYTLSPLCCTSGFDFIH